MAKEKKRDENLPSMEAVRDYLVSQGFRVSLSSLYNHRRQGKLNWDPETGTTRRAALKYARLWLRGQGPSAQEDELQVLARKKLEAEVEKLAAEARKRQFELEVMQGKYLPRSELELELAAREALFEQRLRQFAIEAIPSIILDAGGDEAAVPQAVERFNDLLDEALRELGSVREFQVMVVGSTESVQGGD